MASEAGLTKADTKKALDAFMSAAGNALKAGDKLTLIGFGTYSVVAKPARTGRNPRTKEAVKIPARKVVKFTAGTELKEKVQ